jgi:AcrR family transcriptional regulator
VTPSASDDTEPNPDVNHLRQRLIAAAIARLEPDPDPLANLTLDKAAKRANVPESTLAYQTGTVADFRRLLFRHLASQLTNTIDNQVLDAVEACLVNRERLPATIAALGHALGDQLARDPAYKWVVAGHYRTHHDPDLVTTLRATVDPLVADVTTILRLVLAAHGHPWPRPHHDEFAHSLMAMILLGGAAGRRLGGHWAELTHTLDGATFDPVGVGLWAVTRHLVPDTARRTRRRPSPTSQPKKSTR